MMSQKDTVKSMSVMICKFIVHMLYKATWREFRNWMSCVCSSSTMTFHIILKPRQKNQLIFYSMDQRMLCRVTNVICLFFRQQEIPGECLVSKKARSDVEGENDCFWLLMFNLSPTERNKAFYLCTE